MASDLQEYRSAAFWVAVMIGGAVVFLLITRGSQFHQLAIGILMSAATLAVALALVELCWRFLASSVDPQNGK